MFIFYTTLITILYFIENKKDGILSNLSTSIKFLLGNYYLTKLVKKYKCKTQQTSATIDSILTMDNTCITGNIFLFVIAVVSVSGHYYMSVHEFSINRNIKVERNLIVGERDNYDGYGCFPLK